MSPLIVNPRREADIARVMRELGFDRATAIKHLECLYALRARLAGERRKS